MSDNCFTVLSKCYWPLGNANTKLCFQTHASDNKQNSLCWHKPCAIFYAKLGDATLRIPYVEIMEAACRYPRNITIPICGRARVWGSTRIPYATFP